MENYLFNFFSLSKAPVQPTEYPSECPMSGENGSLLLNTANDVNPLNMVILSDAIINL